MSKHLMRTGEVARLVGVSDKQVRSYEAQGVVKPRRVGDKNFSIRLYTGDDVAAIKAHRAKIARR